MTKSTSTNHSDIHPVRVHSDGGFKNSRTDPMDVEADDDLLQESEYEAGASKYSGAYRFLMLHPIIYSLMLLTVAGLLVLGICYALASTAQCVDILGHDYDSPLQYQKNANTNSNSAKPINIVLFGDSLINSPYLLNNLAGKMDAYLPDFALNIENYGVNGDQIHQMARRVKSMLHNTTDTYAIILYWDSDVSDVGEYRMNTEEIAQLRANYKENLTYVLDEIIAAKPNAYLAVSGPELMGEGPLFSGVQPATYYGKINMLNRYTFINQQISASYGVPYIDMRRAFLDALPPNYYGYQGCLTMDGEHENENGAIIVAKMFSAQILSWLSS